MTTHFLFLVALLATVVSARHLDYKPDRAVRRVFYYEGQDDTPFKVLSVFASSRAVDYGTDTTFLHLRPEIPAALDLSVKLGMISMDHAMVKLTVGRGQVQFTHQHILKYFDEVCPEKRAENGEDVVLTCSPSLAVIKGIRLPEAENLDESLRNVYYLTLRVEVIAINKDVKTSLLAVDIPLYAE